MSTCGLTSKGDDHWVISGDDSFDKAAAVIEHIKKQLAARMDTQINGYLLCSPHLLAESLETRTNEELVLVAVFQLVLVFLILTAPEEAYLGLFQVR